MAASFLGAGLVDEVWLLRGPDAIGAGGVAALHGLPLTAITGSSEFRAMSTELLGADSLTIYQRSQI